MRDIFIKINGFMNRPKLYINFINELVYFLFTLACWFTFASFNLEVRIWSYHIRLLTFYVKILFFSKIWTNQRETYPFFEFLDTKIFIVIGLYKVILIALFCIIDNFILMVWRARLPFIPVIIHLDKLKLKIVFILVYKNWLWA